MVEMVAKTRKYTIDFKLSYTLTLISGDSGTGKTYLCSLIEMCKNANTISIVANNNLQYIVNVVTTLNDLKALLSDGAPHLIFIDKLEQWDTSDRVAAENLILENLRSVPDFNYFIIMHRGLTSLGFVEPVYRLDFSDNKFELS